MAISSFAKPIYLGSAVRSPIGKFGGALLRFSAPQLAALTLKESLRRAELLGAKKEDVELVFLGHARQAGAGPNPARQATVFSGLPESVPAMTLNQACASGLSAVIGAAEKISSGRNQVIMAGGVESMSNTPYLLPDARWGARMGHKTLVDGMSKDGFHCPMSDMLMGATVEEYLAKELKISRAAQDEFALQSQQKATLAWSRGAFKSETFEIEAEGKNPGLKVDEHLRADTTLESLAKLKPVFDPKGGSVTAGNSSGVTDGAAFLRVSDQKVGAQAELLDFEVVALDPRRMGLGPIAAVQKLLKKQKLQMSDIALFELNEAFAAQVLACQLELKIPDAKLNINGGAIAIGHPIGATGARILVTLTHALQGQPGALGVASLCVSGGMGVAVLIRSLN